MASPNIAMSYEDLILDHYKCPHHRGRLETAARTHALRNPQCGDQVRLDLRLDAQDKVAEAGHEAKGRVISQAAASILCEHVERQPAADLAARCHWRLVRQCERCVNVLCDRSARVDEPPTAPGAWERQDPGEQPA